MWGFPMSTKEYLAVSELAKSRLKALEVISNA